MAGGLNVNIKAFLCSVLIGVFTYCFCGCQETLPLQIQKKELAGDWQIDEAQLSDFIIRKLSIPAFSLEENGNVILCQYSPDMFQCVCHDNTLPQWRNDSRRHFHIVFDFLQSQGHNISGRWKLETVNKLSIEFEIPPINENNFPTSDMLIRTETGETIKDSFIIKKTTHGLQLQQIIGDPDERRFSILNKIQ